MLQIPHNLTAYLVLIHLGLQRCQELFSYLYYLIIDFRLVVYIVTCTVYINASMNRKLTV